jgi:hypothetical protein
LSTTDGFHVPVTPLVEAAGSVGTAAPAQMVRLVPKPNVGVVRGITVIVIVIGTLHWLTEGVNV